MLVLTVLVILQDMLITPEALYFVSLHGQASKSSFRGDSSSKVVPLGRYQDFFLTAAHVQFPPNR